MLSVGIRSGQGFDSSSIVKVMQTIPTSYDYDLIVIGSNPGGIKCAREAGLAGKKTALIKLKRYSPAEAEGFDEHMSEAADALEMQREGSIQLSKKPSSASHSDPSEGNVFGSHRHSSTKSGQSMPKLETKNYSKTQSSTYTRKIRQSSLDLTNEFFKRGQQCRKLMQNAALLGDLVENAYKSGWRIPAVIPPFTMNWTKLNEEIMDFVMKENYALAETLAQENVEIIEASEVTLNNIMVKIILSDKRNIQITSPIICLALPADCIFPNDVKGAQEYGITVDDFNRMSGAPGNTLIVGSTPEAVECAGIIASCRFPVTVVTRSKILKDYDSEIVEKIIIYLKSIGVKFLEDTTVTSVGENSEKKLVVAFQNFRDEKNLLGGEKTEFTDVYDTVLFAVGRKVFFDKVDISKIDLHCDPITLKIKADGSSASSVPNIYAVGEGAADRPESVEISEMDGKLLGRRLFHGSKEYLDYTMIPFVLNTPVEYASVGMTEDAALLRLGRQCVDVYYDDFTPLEFIIPHKEVRCFAKIIVFKPNDEVIGLHFFGPGAGEIIQGFAAAMKNKLTMSCISSLIGAGASKAQEILKLRKKRSSKIQEAEELMIEEGIN